MSSARTAIPSSAPLSASTPEGMSSATRRPGALVDELDYVLQIAFDGAGEPGAEERVDHDGGPGESALELVDLVLARGANQGGADPNIGVEVHASVAGHLLFGDRQNATHVDATRPEMPAHHPTITAVVSRAAHHDDRGGLVAHRGDEIGRAPPGVFHEDQPRHVAGVDRVAVERAHFGAREDRLQAPSKTTTAAATPASCVIETIARTTPMRSATRAARP